MVVDDDLEKSVPIGPRSRQLRSQTMSEEGAT